MQNALQEREAAIRKSWREMGLLDRLHEKRKDGTPSFLLDGPPFANNAPHVGHIRNTVYKDLYIRWAFMQGKDVLFQPGFDTHGLPIENAVEKRLELQSKKDIQRVGAARFVAACKESAITYKKVWMEVYDRLGSWYSWKEPYLTYDNSYILSTWWSFKQLWEKGMVYEGKRPVFWCPSCETALAGYEATDSYKVVRDPSIYVKFPVKDQEGVFLLVYTTTPWTLPANVAIMVAPEEKYVKAQTEKDGVLILAKERLPLLRELGVNHTILEEFSGKALDGLRYESVLDVPLQRDLARQPQALRVYLSVPLLKERVSGKVAAKKGIAAGDVYEDFVTVKEGTGLVHCAPGHGKTDNIIGKRYGLPEVSPVDEQCKLTAEAAPFDGVFVKDADHAIADTIHKSGRLLHYGTIDHSYPLCWRCKSPLIFRMSDQWFLSVEPIKEKMLEENEKVLWQPDYASDRFSTWVANADDWNFSRQRFWGIPIPIWKGASGATMVIGSVEELRKHATKPVPEGFDLHEVNDITLKDPKTGEELSRIKDIFDVWFDSGSAPFAALGYPFQNKELFESHFPVDRINESQDQIRGWFYSLMFCSVATFGKAPYNVVSMPGWVLDEKGEKMSKSQGNVVMATDALDEFGADAVRFYYCWDVAPDQTQKFSKDTIKNDVRRFFSIWQNLAKLVEGQGKHFPIDMKEAASLAIAVEDRWLLSRLQSTIQEVTDAVEDFELHLAGRSLARFLVDDVSRTYVQLVRDRLDEEKTPAALLGHLLWQVGILAAAITPYQSEESYRKLRPLAKGTTEESVHLELLPASDETLIDAKLEGQMGLALDIIAALLSARDAAKVGVRWPLEEAVITTDDAGSKEAILLLGDLIRKQTNIRTLDVGAFIVTYDAKPNFQALGKAFGQKTGEAAEALLRDKDAVIKGVTGPDKQAVVEDFTFLPEHLNITRILPGGYTAGDFRKGTVFLKTTVGPALELEGFAREATRRLQQLRKEAGLEKKDRVIAALEAPSELVMGMGGHRDDIQETVGADELLIESKVTKEFAHRSEAVIKGKSFAFFLTKR